MAEGTNSSGLGRNTRAGRRIFATSRVPVSTDRIEVDLNFLHRVALDPPFLAELWQPADAERPSLQWWASGS